MNAPTTPRARERKQPDYITIDPATGAATVTLQYGFTTSGVKRGSVVMRRPKVRDRMAASAAAGGSAAQEELTLFANLMDLAPDELQELDLLDYQRVGVAFKGFLSSETPTNSGEQS